MDTHDRALARLTRPRLLVRAARFGLAEYRRERDLRRLLGPDAPCGAPAAATALFEREAAAEAARSAGAVTYSPARHVELLVALIAEARQASAPAGQATAGQAAPDQAKASV